MSKLSSDELLSYLITPSYFEITKDHARVNDSYYRIVEAVGYPRKIDDGWLRSFLSKNENYDISLHIEPSSINPKSTLAILSQAPPAVIQKAALANDAEYLTKVAGLGRKTAEKVVLGLKDKVLDLGDLNNPAGGLSEDAAALEALQALGYGLAQAREALKKIPAGTLADAGSRIKEALKLLGRQ
jgi:Holliday junction DNA helicase RuvA